ncbi:unnamed protein product [Lupinus luteus]|uniref:Di19 zinc-binding domain-containing protein n=1 Tax=Lupinus luteus TaxID=3873 RepID=A0AAV1X6N7_LUPLU
MEAMCCRFPIASPTLLEDVDGDARSYFRCPLCDFEIVVHVPCNNLEEEHCPDLKIVVCPVCEENFGKDVIRKSTHPNSLKTISKDYSQNRLKLNACVQDINGTTVDENSCLKTINLRCSRVSVNLIYFGPFLDFIHSKLLFLGS